MPRELKFATPKATDDSKKISARTRNEPQRRANGVVLKFDLRPDSKKNEIEVKPVPRPPRKMTPELRDELAAKIYAINDLIKGRRDLEERLTLINAVMHNGLKEIMDLGPFDAKELQDLSHEAFKMLRLYR